MKLAAVVFASVATISGAATADAVPSSASGADGSGILKPAPAATAGSSPADPALDPAGALFLGSSDGTPGLTSFVGSGGGASDVDLLGGGAAFLDAGKGKTDADDNEMMVVPAKDGPFGGSGQGGGGLSVKDDGSSGAEEEMAKEQEKMVQEDEDEGMVQEEEEEEMTTKEEDVETAARTVSDADVGMSAEKKMAVTEGGTSNMKEIAKEEEEKQEEEQEEGDAARLVTSVLVTSVLGDANTDLIPTDTTEAKQHANAKDELQVQDEPKVVKADEKKEDENATAVTSGAVQADPSTAKTVKDQQQQQADDKMTEGGSTNAPNVAITNDEQSKLETATKEGKDSHIVNKFDLVSGGNLVKADPNSNSLTTATSVQALTTPEVEVEVEVETEEEGTTTAVGPDTTKANPIIPDAIQPDPSAKKDEGDANAPKKETAGTDDEQRKADLIVTKAGTTNTDGLVNDEKSKTDGATDGAAGDEPLVTSMSSSTASTNGGEDGEGAVDGNTDTMVPTSTPSIGDGRPTTATPPFAPKASDEDIIPSVIKDEQQQQQQQQQQPSIGAEVSPTSEDKNATKSEEGTTELNDVGTAEGPPSRHGISADATQEAQLNANGIDTTNADGQVNEKEKTDGATGATTGDTGASGASNYDGYDDSASTSVPSPSQAMDLIATPPNAVSTTASSCSSKELVVCQGMPTTTTDLVPYVPTLTGAKVTFNLTGSLEKGIMWLFDRKMVTEINGLLKKILSANANSTELVRYDPDNSNSASSMTRKVLHFIADKVPHILADTADAISEMAQKLVMNSTTTITANGTADSTNGTITDRRKRRGIYDALQDAKESLGQYVAGLARLGAHGVEVLLRSIIVASNAAKSLSSNQAKSTEVAPYGASSPPNFSGLEEFDRAVRNAGKSLMDLWGGGLKLEVFAIEIIIRAFFVPYDYFIRNTVNSDTLPSPNDEPLLKTFDGPDNTVIGMSEAEAVLSKIIVLPGNIANAISHDHDVAKSTEESLSMDDGAEGTESAEDTTATDGTIMFQSLVGPENTVVGMSEAEASLSGIIELPSGHATTTVGKASLLLPNDDVAKSTEESLSMDDGAEGTESAEDTTATDGTIMFQSLVGPENTVVGMSEAEASLSGIIELPSGHATTTVGKASLLLPNDDVAKSTEESLSMDDGAEGTESAEDTTATDGTIMFQSLVGPENTVVGMSEAEASLSGIIELPSGHATTTVGKASLLSLNDDFAKSTEDSLSMDDGAEGTESAEDTTATDGTIMFQSLVGPENTVVGMSEAEASLSGIIELPSGHATTTVGKASLLLPNDDVAKSTEDSLSMDDGAEGTESAEDTKTDGTAKATLTDEGVMTDGEKGATFMDGTIANSNNSTKAKLSGHGEVEKDGKNGGTYDCQDAEGFVDDGTVTSFSKTTVEEQLGGSEETSKKDATVKDEVNSNSTSANRTKAEPGGPTEDGSVNGTTGAAEAGTKTTVAVDPAIGELASDGKKSVASGHSFADSFEAFKMNNPDLVDDFHVFAILFSFVVAGLALCVYLLTFDM